MEIIQCEARLTSRMTSMTGVDLLADATDKLSMTILRRKSITNLRTGWLLDNAPRY